MILALAALERSIRNVAGNNRRLQRGQNAMKNKKWKKFQLLTEECYNNMIGFGENNDCWKQVFELLMEIVLEERKPKPGLVNQNGRFPPCVPGQTMTNFGILLRRLLTGGNANSP